MLEKKKIQFTGISDQPFSILFSNTEIAHAPYKCKDLVLFLRQLVYYRICFQ
jgi:hypothetical protein